MTGPLRIRESNLEAVRDRVAKANRRLDRAGISQRFELVRSERELVERKDPYTQLVTDRYYVVPVELSVPTLGYNGWTFVATLSFEQAGTVVNTVPGQTCSYRPETKVCDQCGHARNRTETFVVRNEQGEFKQLGRNCLELFFGLKPSLWVFELDLSDLEDNEERSSTSSRIEFETVEAIVAAALGATEGGIGYVSKAAAEADSRKVATSGRTWTVLYGKHLPGRDAKAYNDKLDADRALAKTALTDGTVAKVIDAAKAMTGDSEYAENLRVLAACDTVSTRNIGLVASMVAVWSRETNREARNEERAARRNEWIGHVGDKKVETTGTVSALRTIEGDYGTTLLVEWVTTDGLTCKWFASNWYSWTEDGKSGVGVKNARAEVGTAIEVGTSITVVGTIKRHEERNGFKATSFTRCTLTGI